MKLDLGAGRQRREGFTTVDLPGSGADIECDIGEESLYDPEKETLMARPVLTENSVEEVIADNVLEHLSPGEEIIHAMNEIHRVMKPGGRFTIIVPDVISDPRKAFRDPTHRMFWTTETFEYFCIGYPRHSEWGKMYGIKGWKMETRQNVPDGFITAVLEKP